MPAATLEAPRESVLRRLSDVLVARRGLYLMLLLVPPLLWLGIVYLGSLFALLAQSFFSPLANKRTDEYGGSLENRVRYHVETLDAVRSVWPERSPAQKLKTRGQTFFTLAIQGMKQIRRPCKRRTLTAQTSVSHNLARRARS